MTAAINVRGKITMVNKEKIVNDLAERTGRHKYEVREIIDAFIDIMRDYLVDGEKVMITRLFTATVRDYNRSIGRNPRTGETVEIAPCKKVNIKASKTLNNAINAKA